MISDAFFADYIATIAIIVLLAAILKYFGQSIAGFLRELSTVLKELFRELFTERDNNQSVRLKLSQTSENLKETEKELKRKNEELSESEIALKKLMSDMKELEKRTSEELENLKVENQDLKDKLEQEGKAQSEVITENELLRAEIEKLKKEKMPFMDAKHPFHSEKLESAVNAWNILFANRTNDLPAKELKIADWLYEHRVEVSEHASIIRVVNPGKTTAKRKK